MQLAFAATNPCHIFPLARAVANEGESATFYTGYPRWKLGERGKLKVRSNTWRTLATYGMLRLPPKWRPDEHKLFSWQDRHFDKWAGRAVRKADFVHGLPGQCLHLFQAAKRKGIATVLNHATGPVENLIEIMEPEYERHNLKMSDYAPYDAEYLAQIQAERKLADYHAVASRIVRDQLVKRGVASDKIWIIPYGADETIFNHGLEERKPGKEFRVIFAGQLSLRKGIRVLLEAFEKVKKPGWRLDFYGSEPKETVAMQPPYNIGTDITKHGSVSPAQLAEAFRQADVLVLPSWEEGFGLVVVQALACGCPCLVSGRVGAKDLIRTGINGAVFPAGDSAALGRDLVEWSEKRIRAKEAFSWSDAAQKLIELSREAAGK